jgi:hypothetical protein
MITDLHARLVALIDSKQDIEIQKDYELEIYPLKITGILPGLPTREALKSFMANMIVAGRKNPHLVKVVNLAKKEEIEFDDDFINGAYRGILVAWMCEEYTKLSLTDNDRYMTAQEAILKQYTWTDRILKRKGNSTTFNLIKHLTMAAGVFASKRIKGKFDRYAIKPYVALNIAEAMAATSNPAKWSGAPLLLNQAYCVDDNDSELSLVKFQNTRDWINLYIIWNLAFIVDFDGFEEIAFKLFFPTLTSVPEHFIEKRITSLHAILALSADRVYNKKCPEKLREILYKVANEAAIEYAAINFNTHPTPINRLILGLTVKKCA